jgi:hypothetical protein
MLYAMISTQCLKLVFAASPLRTVLRRKGKDWLEIAGNQDNVNYIEMREGSVSTG